MKMNLPKVLIIGPSFCHTGGGITMTNLFSQWDKDKLAVACTGYYLNLKINTSVCDTYYQLGEKEHTFKFPLNYLQKKFASGPININSSHLFKLNTSHPGIRERFINKVFYPFLEFIGIFHGLSRINLSKEFCEWLNNYNADIIYAQAFSLEGIRFSIAIQDYLGKPMAFHMMDDWPSSISEMGPFKKFWFKKIDREFRILLDRSCLLLSIGQDMSEEYKRRYAKDFIPFHNPIKIDSWKKYQKNNYVLTNKPTILYAGRIGIGIDSSLELIAKAIEKVNSDLGISITFILRTEEKPNWINSYPSVQHKNYVAYKDIPKVLSEADFLIIPYDFSTESIKFIKYSIPTKASEYMMSGTPTILFAPPDTAIVNFTQKYNCFELITKNSIVDLSTSIKRIITDLPRRKQLAKRASLIAEQKFNSKKITTEFQNVLCSIIDKKESNVLRLLFHE